MTSKKLLKVVAAAAVLAMACAPMVRAEGEVPKDKAAPAPEPIAMVTTSQVEIKMHREPIRQLGRGAANLLTGLWEIPANILSVNKENGDIAGATYGVLRGVWRFGVREVTGAFEVVTFPFGWQPIIEPEFYMEPSRYTEWRVTWPPRWSQEPGF